MDYDPFRVATPLQLLQLIQRLGVSGRVIARWLGVKPAAISMWARERRPLPLRYEAALRLRAEHAWAEAVKRNEKDVSVQPTEALRRAVQSELATLYDRWKLEVLHEAGTALRQAHQQYHALAGWVLKERYEPEDVESVKVAMEGIVQQMERVIRLQGEAPSAEDALVARLAQAHDAATPVTLSAEERAKAEADQPDRLNDD
jgi:hypothetical protein